MIGNPFFPLLGGVDIVVDESLGLYRKQVRFPRSKKKRIRKKWRRKRCNWIRCYDGPKAFLIKERRLPFGMGTTGPTLIMNPEAKALLDQELAILDKAKEMGQKIQQRLKRDVVSALLGSSDPLGFANDWTTENSASRIILPPPCLPPVTGPELSDPFSA